MTPAPDPDSAEYHGIHDHYIYAISNDLDAGILVIHTRCDQGGDFKGKYIDLAFTGVMTFDFSGFCLNPNLILSLEESPPSCLRSGDWPEIAGRFMHSLQAHEHTMKDVEALIAYLEGKSVQVYELIHNIGGDVFVLAESREYRFRSKKFSWAECGV